MTPAAQCVFVTSLSTSSSFENQKTKKKTERERVGSQSAGIELKLVIILGYKNDLALLKASSNSPCIISFKFCPKRW